MGANTIIMINQASKRKKDFTVRGDTLQLGWKRKMVRSIIDQVIWMTTLVLLADMAMKNKRRRLMAWWADR